MTYTTLFIIIGLYICNFIIRQLIIKRGRFSIIYYVSKAILYLKVVFKAIYIYILSVIKPYKKYYSWLINGLNI
jgi:hypothetical protein